ncbi:MAG: histidinol dehydrogenase [Pseudomonadota bacterium]
MARRLHISDADFEAEFEALIRPDRAATEDVRAVVADILEDVRDRGADAVADYTKRFDGFDLSAVGLRVSDAEISASRNACAPEALDALAFAADRIRAYHERQRPPDEAFTDAAGVRLGWRWTPLDAVGLYVPGGLASYPSSVLMNAIPAKAAGVPRIAMVAPTPNGELNPLVLAAARIAGVDEVYRIGGAQAVGALAFGIEGLAPVHKIVGPGNAYVAEAKRQVFGVVGIDMIAGPSEILVVADGQNDPNWIAADLLSQAEHDTAAQSILITDDAAFANAVSDAVDRQLAAAPRADIARASWSDHGAIIVVDDLRQGADLANRIAAEHLELAVDDPDALAAEIRHAGAIFLGRHAPEAVGDYVAGSNHVLPTAGSARFSSGLGTLDFLKRTSLIGCDAGALGAIGPAAATLADAEGLFAHGYSVRVRSNR